MRWYRSIAAALALFAATPSSAAVVRLGLGADYLVNDTGEFNLTVAIGAHVVRFLQVGGRFGLLVASSPNYFGVPLDLFLRANIPETHIYVEALAGPWIYFVNENPVRAHAAFGFGAHFGQISFGLEAGYVTPDVIIGARVAFAFF
jgi:hypothetical protein